MPDTQNGLESLKDDLLEAPTIAAPAPSPVEPPSRTYGHYVIEKRPDGSPWILGRGGMGVTYKAKDGNLECAVALKVISAHHFNDGERRFVREAQLAAQIRHPNVAAIHHLDSQDGQYFYAMEFVDGISAEAWVLGRGAMPVNMALDIVMQIARALTAADQLHVLHRDIKPANIMILPDPANPERVIAKLIDFGLARSNAAISPAATTCAFTGTPQFASPEQAESLELDTRSDIYSLGSTLWYLLVGEAPFTGTPARVLAQLLTADPPWERVRRFPPEIIRLLRRMLAKDPSGRPQNPVSLHHQIIACREALAEREAEKRKANELPANAMSSLGLRAGAIAAMLLVLVCLAINHRSSSSDGSTESAIASASPGQTENAKPAPLQDPLPQAAPVVPSTPDAAFVANQPPTPVASPQPPADGNASVAPNNNSPDSGPVANDPNADGSQPTAGTPSPMPTPDPGRRHAKRHHSSSPFDAVDKVRGSVAGLLHHIF